jgi:hypothetical protein
VIKAIMAILRTTLPGCDDGPWRQAFKALLPGDKEEKKKVRLYLIKFFNTLFMLNSRNLDHLCGF